MLILMLGMGWFVGAHAEVYRWVDEQGNVHFGDSPPVTRGSEEVAVDVPRDVPAPAPAPVADESTDDEPEPLVVLPQVPTARKPDPVAVETRARQQQRQRCDRARIDWGILTEEMPVYRASDGNYRPAWDGDTYEGTRDYVPDAERVSLARQAKTRIFEFCDDPEDTEALFATYDDWVQTEYCKVAEARYRMATLARTRTPRAEVERIRQEMTAQCRK